MTEEAAERFAAALLKQFGRDREFKFELPDGHNIDFVRAALERAGCYVEAGLGDTNALIVRVPDVKVS